MLPNQFVLQTFLLSAENPRGVLIEIQPAPARCLGSEEADGVLGAQSNLTQGRLPGNETAVNKGEGAK